MMIVVIISSITALSMPLNVHAKEIEENVSGDYYEFEKAANMRYQLLPQERLEIHRFMPLYLNKKSQKMILGCISFLKELIQVEEV